MEIQELLNECEAKADKTIENFKRNVTYLPFGPVGQAPPC